MSKLKFPLPNRLISAVLTALILPRVGLAQEPIPAAKAPLVISATMATNRNEKPAITLETTTLGVPKREYGYKIITGDAVFHGERIITLIETITDHSKKKPAGSDKNSAQLSRIELFSGFDSDGSPIGRLTVKTKIPLSLSVDGDSFLMKNAAGGILSQPFETSNDCDIDIVPKKKSQDAK